MLTDWMTNLWAPEHYQEESIAGAPDRALPERHREDVAAVVDEFVVTALQGPYLGLNVPNDYVAEYVREFPGRAVGLAAVDPASPDAQGELVRAIRDLGLHGLKLAPTFQGFDPWSPQAWDIYELANEMNIPIYWHQAGGSKKAPLELADPVKLDKIARAFPEMPLLLEHFALPWGNIAVEIAKRHDNVYIDICARVIRQWDMYNCLRLAMDYGITDRILFASDFPVQTPEESLSSFRVFATDELKLPPIPEKVIEAAIYDRPLSLVFDR